MAPEEAISMAQDGVHGHRPSRVTEWARRGRRGSRATEGQPRRARFFAPHTKKSNGTRADG